MSEQPKKQDLRIDLPANLRGGVYCNNMIVTSTKEEFIMDFMMVVPPAGAVTARVIMSPGNMKRTVAALHKNLQNYETKFGKGDEIADRSFNYDRDGSDIKSVAFYEYGAANLSDGQDGISAADLTPEQINYIHFLLGR